MKTKFIANFVFVILALSVLSIAYSCKSDDTTVTPSGPDNNSINGTLTFVDTGFVSTGGTYLIAAYSSWPPMAGPSSYDTVRISRNATGRWNQTYSYKLSSVANGSYALSVGFRKATGGQSPIMGVYGCDTTHNMCVVTTTSRATITNNAGVTGIDFMCWADTTKKLY